MQCEHVLHSTMWPSGLESESESVTEWVSSNVNELLGPLSYGPLILNETKHENDTAKKKKNCSGISYNNHTTFGLCTS